MYPLVRNVIAPSLIKCFSPAANVFYLQFVRWRKPVYAKINSSKLFYVRKKGEEPVLPPDVFDEQMEIYYRYIDSLRRYFKEELEAREKLSSAVAVEHNVEEWKDTLEVNKRWNEETGKIREKWIASDAQRKEEMQLAQLMQQEKEKAEKVEEARRIVLETLEESKSFIKRENLVAEIERALDAPISYNFAIDLNGNWHVAQANGSVKTLTEAEKLTVTNGKLAPHWTVSFEASVPLQTVVSSQVSDKINTLSKDTPDSSN